MLLTAIKLKVAALALVAGIETNDLPNQSAELKATLDTLAAAEAKVKDKTQDPVAGSDWNAAFTSAVQKVQDLAAKGDANANYVIAKWGILTGGKDININAIVDLYRKAGDNPAAQVELAQILLQAFKQDADKAREAVALIIKAEAAGNKLARRMKAQLLLSGGAGDLLKQDTAEAVKLFQSGSEAGDGEATLSLYQIYSRGITGVPQDFAKALEMLKLAAEKQSNATALGELGSRLLNGDKGDGKSAPNLVQKDVKAALDMFEKSATGGLPAANRILGQIYENGVGTNGADVKQDSKKAFDYYTKAAQGNDAAALYRLGLASETGIAASGSKPDDKGNWDPKDIVVSPNAKNALDLYRLAAQNNAAEAFFKVGSFYESGTVVDRDPIKAFQFYTRAANAGIVPAMHQLAGLYANGNGTTQDIVAAAAWFKRAADAGYADSQIIYGDMNARGAGMAQSLVAAEANYENAAQQGSILGLLRLAILHAQVGVAPEPQSAKPNLGLGWAYAQLASELTNKSNNPAKAQVDAFVAQLEAATIDGKPAVTSAIKEAGVKELARLKEKFKNIVDAVNNAGGAPAAAAPAAESKKSDSKKKQK